MMYNEFAEQRLNLEARLRETYEEEFEQQRILDLEREQLVARLRENYQKFCSLHAEKDELRKGLREAIVKLEAEYKGKEADHE